jgi:hypothetical protein
MKNLYILTFFIFFFSNVIYAQSSELLRGGFVRRSNYFILNLPYEINDNVEYIFDEDTPYAIDIIEIWADSKKLSFIDDYGAPECRNTFRIYEVIDSKKQYFVSMIWRSENSDYLRWNDGRGIIFTEIQPNLFSHKTNSYEVHKDTKILKIKYRILLPYSSLKLDDLNNKTYPENFSKEKEIIVYVSKFFLTAKRKVSMVTPEVSRK